MTVEKFAHNRPKRPIMAKFLDSQRSHPSAPGPYGPTRPRPVRTVPPVREPGPSEPVLGAGDWLSRRVCDMQDPPVTGNLSIDDALARVAEAVDVDGETKAQLLSDAQSVLQDVLRTSREEAPAPSPR